MDRGVWRATVRGIARSWTQLKRLMHARDTCEAIGVQITSL